MANPLSAMLDELMGRHRNVLPSEKPRDTRWDDKEVCPYFVAGYCPHDLFTNTKADLGLCDKIHDEKLREQYRKSSRFEQVGVEDEFLHYLQKVDSDMRRKISRNKQRLDLTQPGGEVDDLNRDSVDEKITQLSEKITALLTQAEQLGAEGKVEESQSVIAMMEELKEERDRCRKTLDTPSNELKLMEVCETCGCFLILGDSQHRLDEHLTGKQHTGFAKIRASIEELIRRKDEKRKQRDEELRKLREDRHTSRDSSSKREHRDKDREKDKEKTNEKREKDKEKEKSKETSEKKVSDHKRSHRDRDHKHGSSHRHEGDESSKRHRSRSGSRGKKSKPSHSEKSRSHDKSGSKHSSRHDSHRSSEKEKDKSETSDKKHPKREKSSHKNAIVVKEEKDELAGSNKQQVTDDDNGCDTEVKKSSTVDVIDNNNGRDDVSTHSDAED